MRSIAAYPNTTEPKFADCTEPPEPRAGEVVCRTLQLGICGTDREILDSKNPFRPAGSDHLVLGHECLACVDAIGPGVDEVAVGDLVVPLVRRAIATPEHRVDLLTPGDYIERGITYAHGFSPPLWLDESCHLIPVANEVADLAILAEPLSISEKAANEAALLQAARLGEHAWRDTPPRVLVTGMGPIGFSGVIAARCRGWPVWLYGRDSEDSFRAELAVALGAEYVPAARGDLVPNEAERHGYDLILECTGDDGVMLESARALAARGVMVWLGSSRTPTPRNANVAVLMRDVLVRNQICLGSVNSAARDFRDALEHLGMFKRDAPKAVAALITARMSIDDALWHYSNREPQGVKAIVEYDSL